MKNLVKKLKTDKTLRNDLIINAFKHVDRADFVSSNLQDISHVDIALPIGHGQTISQPSTVAFMLELLNPKPGEKILEIGSGSGWVIALLAQAVGKNGKVFGVEIIPELVSLGRKNLEKYEFLHAQILPAKKSLGISKEAPFDRILISASAQKIPIEILRQLKINGTLVLPIKDSLFKIVKKPKIELSIQEFPGFVFVPLIEK